jgi:hypothetical protein
LRRASGFLLLISTEKFRKAKRLAADPGVVALMTRFNTAQRQRPREVFPVAAKDLALRSATPPPAPRFGQFAADTSR